MGWPAAPTAGPAPGALAGRIRGCQRRRGMGLGAGSNVLVGGSGRSLRCNRSRRRVVALNVTLGLSGLQLPR